MQPMTLVVVPCGTTPTSRASTKTVAHRNKVLNTVRGIVSAGDSTSQMQCEVHHLGKEERQELLRSAGITVDIPVDVGVAMKAELALTRTKLKVIRVVEADVKCCYI